MVSRQEAAAEQAHSPMRGDRATRLQHDKTRQVLILTTQPIVHPCASTRVPHEREARVHEVVALGVLADRARHGTHDRKFIGHTSDLREHGTDRDPALPVAAKGEGRSHHVSVLIELRAFDLDGQGLAVQPLQFWLRIERIDLGHPTRHETEYHVFRPRNVVGQGPVIHLASEAGLCHQTLQGQEAEAVGCLAQ